MLAPFKKMAAERKKKKAEKNLAKQDTDKKPGLISKGMTKLKDNLKDITSGMKSTGGWMLKGLALGALFMAYGKWKDKIDGAIAKIFEVLHKTYKSFESGDLTFESLVGTVEEWGAGIIEGLQTKTLEFMDWLWDLIKRLSNKHLGTWWSTDKDIDIQEYLVRL